MKPIQTMAHLVFATYIVATLGACSKTSNSSDQPAAATPASSCSRSWDGTLRDQYGRTCSNYSTGGNNCVNARLNPATGQYVDVQTGVPVSCNPGGYFDGHNSVPYHGTTYGGQQFSGCQGWSYEFPGQTYVPVDLGNGQLACLNYAYLTSQYPQASQYSASYYYSQPIYTCSGYDCGGGGSGYSGGCQNAMQFGYYNEGSGFNFGLCGIF